MPERMWLATLSPTVQGQKQPVRGREMEEAEEGAAEEPQPVAGVLACFKTSVFLTDKSVGYK